MNLVAPFGFYGAGNIGDEATLQGFARLLLGWPRNIRVSVASRDPLHTARVEPSFRYFKAVGRDPRRWWAKYRSDAFVFPGGTPIMDVLGSWPFSELIPIIKSAEAHGKAVHFVGTGTEKLGREESRRLFADVIAPRVRRWSVRCERDKNRLTDYGVAEERVTVAADMAWLLDPVTTDFGRQYLRRLGLAEDAPYLGVDVNSESFMLEQEPRLLEKLAGFLDTLIERYGFRVLFLCNEVREDDMFDKATSLKIRASMRRSEGVFSIPNEYFMPQQMLSLIACCHATVSTRYHFCLFSALQKVPFLALERSDKVADLCWDMQWQYGTSLSDVDVAVLSDAFSEIERRRTEMLVQLENRTQCMRAKALMNNVALDVLTLH